MENEKLVIQILLVASLGLFVGAVANFFRKRTGKSDIGRTLIFSGHLLGAVWCLRFAVGCYGSASEKLTPLEEALNSLVHALQTFSMDESYTEYVTRGKAMISAVLGENVPWLPVGYGIYASVLNAVAPIAGGAILFEILASIFPKIQLWLSYKAHWREKYYFSKLNDESLALAKSIRAANSASWKRPVLIFTDAYVDADKEKEVERVLAAKLLGAFCLEDDLAHVRKNKHGRRKFFLIDTRESGNLQTLTAMAEPINSRYLKKSEVYLFVEDDAYVQVEKNICQKLRADWQMPEKDIEDLPLTIIPVRSFRNMISNLLVELPLYEPLIHKAKKDDGTRDLTVTILGTGRIGMEMFLSTYWFGQILDCNLKINVLSQENEASFWDKIDYLNTEIRRTMKEKGIQKPQDTILQVNRKGDMAPAYCEVFYKQCDVKSSKFIECLGPGADSILDTDYYLVALGSDEDNVSVANTVKRYVGEHHINVVKNRTQKTPDQTVIAYVVYSPELSDALNGDQRYAFAGDVADVYMCAAGNLRDVYSVQNVFLDKHEALAQDIHAAYDAIKNHGNRANIHKKRLKEDYKHWSNLAAAMHHTYRMFSAGVDMPSRIESNGSLTEARDLAIKKAKVAQCRAMNQEKENCRRTISNVKYKYRQGDIVRVKRDEEVEKAKRTCKSHCIDASKRCKEAVAATWKEYNEAVEEICKKCETAFAKIRQKERQALVEAKAARKRILADRKGQDPDAICQAKRAYRANIKKIKQKNASLVAELKRDRKEALTVNSYQKGMKDAAHAYDCLINGTDPATMELLHKLAWLEHRRWNAFTRVQGFRSTHNYGTYARRSKLYKQMDLKLHPCLVECDQKGIRIITDENGNEMLATFQKDVNRQDFDLLDDLSCELKQGGFNNYDFKAYDYPLSDYRNKLEQLMK